VNLQFNSVPTGLVVYVDGLPRTTPFVYDTLINFHHVIEAPRQTRGTSAFAFASWSDGGSAEHTITVPAATATFTANFSETAMPAGLRAAYNFNETTGTSAADASGNSNTATLVNGAAHTPGMYGNALLFDGANDRVTVPNSTSLNIAGSALTLAFWINPQPSTADVVVLGKFWNAIGMAAPYYQYGIELNNGNEPQFYVGTNTGVMSATMGAALAFGVWTHIAITFDGASVRFYRNGQLLTTQPLAAAIVARGNLLGLGADNQPAQFYMGMLDELRIYQRTLSLAEVQTDMATAF